MGMDPWGGGDLPDADALRPSFLADALGVTPKTVRERVQRMEDRGVIARYEAYPEPGQLDLDVTAVHLAVPEGTDKAHVVETLALLDGVFKVTDLRGPGLLVGLGIRTDRDRARRMRLLAREVGDGDPQALALRRGRRDQRPLTALDWRIVAALRGRADRPLAEVAEAVGVSYRTVKRRVDRMQEERSLCIAPVVDVARIDGVVPFDLFVVLEDGADDDAVSRVAGLFPDRRIQRYVPPGKDRWFVDLLLYAHTLAEVEDMRRKAAGTEGVARVETFLRRAAVETDWLDALIEARAADGGDGADGTTT